MNAAEIIFVRHGETESNRAGRLQGRSDLPMNETGRRQAAGAALELAGTGTWDVVVSSPLFRARQSAQIIADLLGAPRVQEFPELMERDYGDAEGTVVTGLSEDNVRRLMDLGESEEHLVERAINVLFKISVQHPGQRVVVVSHGSLIRSVLSALHGTRHEWVPNGQVLRVETELLTDHVAREPLWH
ncbi:histidine phosphatase family protein [Glutamicibacter ardleyensis]|uniref:histidine phosphatase family protein n=1 Tax=Glutamicibacter ardleyensis TaxID=225894 RepID=UPI003F91FFB8